jgi:group I intron endonuclease
MEVYLITNKLNGKYYVGQTKYTAFQRWQEHVYCATRLADYDGAIYRAIRKHGCAAFTVESLCSCPDRISANAAEMFFIWFLASNKRTFGYNMTEGGEFGEINEAALRKKQNALLGYWASKSPEERRKHMSAAFSVPWTSQRREAKRSETAGKKLLQATREKMAQSQTQRWALRSEQDVASQAEKMRNFQISTPTFKNKTHSDDNREIMSAASKAYWTEENKAARSRLMKQRHLDKTI